MLALTRQAEENLWPQGWTRLRTRVWQNKAHPNDVNDVESEHSGEGHNVINVIKIEEGEGRGKEEEEYRDGYR